jgi:hypothetical protein
MPHCEKCHADYGEESEPEVIVEAEHTEKPDVEIARIQADRDIKLARITAGVVDIERDVELAAAEAKAGVLGEIVSPPEAEPEVVVLDEPEPESVPEPEPEGALPEVEESHEHAPKRDVWWG